MKRKLIFIFLSFCFLLGNAQDSIYLVNNAIISARITDITPDDITYKNFNNLDGPNYHQKISNILRIKYSNGVVEFYTENENFGYGAYTDRGEPASIILKTDKVIPCEILDITKLCVIYKEKFTDENTLVFMKYAVDRILKTDSSYITFNEDGQEVKHPKPEPVKVIPPPEPVVVTPVIKEPDPVVTDKKPDPVVVDKKPDPIVVDKKPDPVVPVPPAPANNSRITLRGDCKLMNSQGDFIYTHDVIVDIKNQIVIYTDKENKVINKKFGDIRKIYFFKGSVEKGVDLNGEFELEDLKQ